MASDLPLELPCLAIGVEYAITEKVSQGDLEEVPLLIVVEVVLEEMLHVGGVGREDDPTAEAAVEGEGEVGGGCHDL